jgi:hypothetical protein
MAPGSGQAMKQIPHPVQPAPAYNSGAIAVVIQVLAHADHLGRTGFNAQSAALALVNIDPQQASIAFCRLPSFGCSYRTPAAFQTKRGRRLFALQIMGAHCKIFQFLLKARIGNGDQRLSPLAQRFPCR